MAMHGGIEFEVNATGHGIGAEISGIDLSEPLGEEAFDRIHAAWLEHLVLIFRDQRLSDADLKAFSRRFGELDQVPGWEPFAPAGHPEILVVSNVTEDGTPIGVLGDGEAAWHTDMAYIELPPAASLLYALEIPDSGGETSFMNMYAALDSLPDELREAVRGKQLNHDASHDSGGNLRPNHRPFADVTSAPGVRHPLVRTHPQTGRPALFLGRRLHAWVVGERLSDSESLLDRLWEHCEQGDFVYRHRWRPGDLLMWDNRVTMHRRDPFDGGQRRVMHRTQLRGREPVVAAAEV
ncbi:MAG: TauD/TfdA family dioxygenase [Alphaproteobacteria bacterium]|nr:TauD/TfdA family dioxygenase [Alphaproteobacteria bacterium]